MLYRYCSERGIPHKQIGKLIVASSVAEVPKLEILLERGKENGVRDLRMMEGSEALQMEPEVRCVKAILSPSSGIIDSHELMLSLVVLSMSLCTEDFVIDSNIMLLIQMAQGYGCLSTPIVFL